MPPQLDDDVVLIILDELAAPAYSLEEYLDQQATLLHLCRASRQLHRLASPLLGRQLCLCNRRQLSLLRSAGTIKNRATRCFIAPKVVAGGNAYIDALDLLPNLVDVSFELSSKHADYFRFPQSISALNLRRLSLANVVLSSTTNPVLPHLEALRLSDSRLSVDVGAAWLQPASMPSLRTLSLVRLAGPPGTRDNPLGLAHELSYELLQQLEFLHWSTSNSYEAYTHDVDWPSSTTPPVLFDFPSPRTLNFPRHVIHTASHLPQAALDVLGTFAATVPLFPAYRDAGLTCVLVLPQRFLDFGAAHPGVAVLLGDLELACAAVGGRVMWYDGDATTRGVDIALPEFCEYARVLKAAR